jgi:hypothetical protein
MPPTQISCPRCRVPQTAEIQQLFDLNTDPQAKQKLLSGAANVVRCQACGYEGLYPTPIVYHDPEKELLLTYFPPELAMSINEQERLVGPLIKRVVNDLVPEKRKAYIFQAQSMLTYQTLMERVLQADGVTKEMLDAQQARLQLIQRLLSTPAKESRKEIIVQEEKLIDEGFFSLLSRLMEATLAQGDQQSAQQLAIFQQELLQESTVGKKIQEQMKDSQKAMEDVQNAAKEGLTREKLLELFIQAPSDIYITTLLGVTRTGLDYEFFQLLSSRIESATDTESKDSLTSLREHLLEATKEIDAQIQKEMASAHETVDKILAFPTLEEGIQKFGNEANDFFTEAVQNALAEARKSADLEKITKLNQLIKMIEDANQPPAEIQFVEELLSCENDQAIKEKLTQNPQFLGDEFVQLIAGIIGQSEQQGQAPELIARLRQIQKVVLKTVMAENLKK